MDDMMMDPGLFGPMDPGAGGDSSADAAAAKKKAELEPRKKADLITEVKELKLWFYTLALPGEDKLIQDKFKEKLKNSKFFSGESDGYVTKHEERGDEKDGLTSFVVVLKLKEPIRK